MSDTEDRDCVGCGVTVQLMDSCEWPDDPSLTLCPPCAISKLEDLIKERDEALEWARKLQNDTQVLTCVFCGQSYPPGTPKSGAKALLDHIFICREHPLHDLASNYNFAIDAMRITQRLFNLTDGHILMQACLNMEATAERFEKLRDI